MSRTFGNNGHVYLEEQDRLHGCTCEEVLCYEESKSTWLYVKGRDGVKRCINGYPVMVNTLGEYALDTFDALVSISVHNVACAFLHEDMNTDTY